MAPASPRVFLDMATHALESGDTDAAIATLSATLAHTARPSAGAARILLTEAFMLRGDLGKATEALNQLTGEEVQALTGSWPSALARARGRLAFYRGEQATAIAWFEQAVALSGSDNRARGQAHLALAQSYRKAGDGDVLREHLTEAAIALHQAGDRRTLALLHSFTATVFGQTGWHDEATTAFDRAEGLARRAGANDVLAMVYSNQATLATLRQQLRQAQVLAERAVALEQRRRGGPGLARALANLGQIRLRLGDLSRAEQILRDALDARCAVQFHETTGAIFDSLAQLALLRGDYEGADEHLRAALAAFGAYGRNTGTWYSWSLRTIAARIAIRRGDATGAVAIADDLSRSPSTPPNEVLEAQLIGIEALLTAARVDEALARLRHAGQHLDPTAAPTRAAEFQRLMGLAQLHRGFPDVAERHLRASVAGFDQTGDRYQSAMSRWALARARRARGRAEDARYLLAEAEVTLEALGAVRDLDALRADAQLTPDVARQTTPLPRQ
jgi:tetratricopeptide (TPR) repeat protein